MTEDYHHAEKTKKIEPGVGPNPSWSQAPSDASSDDQSTATDPIVRKHKGKRASSQ
jgi:hypothetical protein